MMTAKPELTVKMANELIRAAHNLDLIEKRVLMLAITKIDSNSALTGKNQAITLTVSEYLKEYEANQKSSYRDVSKAVDALDKSRVRFTNKAIGEHGTIHWTTGTRYKPKEGCFVLSINGDLMPYLQGLKEHFTIYKLHRVSGLKSSYSWRLFELLMQFKKTGLLNILVDDFNHAMDAPESLRANFANLRARIIEPAVKEIREKDGLAVEWEAIKAGRKVKALKFTFPTEQQLSLDTPVKAPNSANTTRNDKQATKYDNSKTKSVEPELMSLSDIKSRLKSAKELAELVNAPIETYLTARDKEAIAHYGLTI